MSEQDQKDKRSKRLSMRIRGMHCAACVATIEEALLEHESVSQASVSLLDEKAVIEFNPELADRVTLEKIV
ncbi:MAG: cation transporter, partial [Promethearchaeota archaeon]